MTSAVMKMETLEETDKMTSAVMKMETKEENDKMTSAVMKMETKEENGIYTVENGSPSPSRPTVSPDIPEQAHGMSRSHSPEDDEVTEVGSLVTQEMLEEEKKLQQENVDEEEQLRKKLEERDIEEKELKERRYKRLMHLLTKSEFYSQFLLKQIDTQDNENKKKRAKSRFKNESVDKENSSSSANSSQESTGTKRTGSKRPSKNSRPAKRLREGTYNIGDVIDSDTVKANAMAHNEEPEDIERIDQPRLFEHGVMRPYQLDGYSWLTVLYENGVNGILGDEMGLGKTIQCIALICHLVDKGVQGPFLVVGPLSTLPNWMAEFKRFAPKIPTLLYHGYYTVRQQKRHEISKLFKVDGAPNKVHPVVITSYEVATRDMRTLNRYQWRYICVDEGHRLKNHQCRLAKALNTFSSSNRLLLTGTPLQNNLAELWALLNFLMPEIFDSLDVFESWFDVKEMMEEGSNERIVQQEREKQVIHTLMKILSPFFLRRVKKDVDLDLPPKKELLVYTPMTPTQVEMYEATLTHDMDLFDKMKKKCVQEKAVEYDERGRPKRKAKRDVDYAKMDDDNIGVQQFEKYLDTLIEDANEVTEEPEAVQRTSVLRVKLACRWMQCRRIVNHPYLLNYPLNPDGSYKVDNDLIKTCGKLQVLDQLLAELHKNGHRVLLFSQMTMLMDVLEDYLTLRPQYKYKRLDGRVDIEERQSDILEFNKDPSFFLFLLSTRAGGLGINLASADTVIIYDSDWNPQCDLQAQDRCHRIGQTRPVLILRLITASTIDEYVVDRAATKRKLEKLIIQSGKFTSASQSERKFEKLIDPDELLHMLQHRDHDREHRTETGNVFSQKELNQLLDRSDLVTLKQRNAGAVPNHQLEGVFKCVDFEA